MSQLNSPPIIINLPTGELRLSPQHATSRFRDEEALGRSILEVGILQPVWAVQCDDGWEVLAGQRRVACAIRLGLKTVPIRELSSMGNDRSAWRRAGLVQHAHATGFNMIEQVAAMKGLIDHFGLDRSAILSHQWMELVGWRSNGWILEDALAVAEVSESSLAWFHQLDMGLKPTAALARLGGSATDRLARWSRVMRLGPNRIRPLITLVEEIAQREKKTAVEIIDEMDKMWMGPAGVSEESMPFEKLLIHLRDRRTPRLARLRENLHEKVDALNLPPTARLEIPPTFESDKMELHLRADSADAFREGLDRLVKSVDGPQLDDLYRFIRDGLEDR